ncbi:MAG: hypothetical protein JWO78_1847 [Micavibrio sp.]|nr:hypothetical protein [Micavibrio sp.]
MDYKNLKPLSQPGSLRDLLLKSNKLNFRLNSAVATTSVGEDVPFTSVTVEAVSSALPGILGVEFNKIAGNIFTAHNVSLKHLGLMVSDKSIVSVAKGDRVYPVQNLAS